MQSLRFICNNHFSMEHSSSLKSNKTIIHTTQKNVPSIYNLKTKEKALKNEFKCKEKVNQD